MGQIKKTVIDNFLDEEVFNKLRDFVTGTHFEWYFVKGVAKFPHHAEEQNLSSSFFTHLFYDHHVPISQYYQNVIPLFNKIQEISSITGGKRKSGIPLYSVDPQGYTDENDPYDPYNHLDEEIKSLLRVRANYYPNTSTLLEHPMHIDREYSHTAALLSLNTCDGYTKLEDGTKFDSVANRVIFFDASKKHCSTTTTNTKSRFNIIVNYL